MKFKNVAESLSSFMKTMWSKSGKSSKTFVLSEEGEMLLTVADAVLDSSEPWRINNVEDATKAFPKEERDYLRDTISEKAQRMRRDLLRVSMQRIILGEEKAEYGFANDAMDLGYQKAQAKTSAQMAASMQASTYQSQIASQQALQNYQNQFNAMSQGMARAQNVLGNLSP